MTETILREQRNTSKHTLLQHHIECAILTENGQIFLMVTTMPSRLIHSRTLATTTVPWRMRAEETPGITVGKLDFSCLGIVFVNKHVYRRDRTTLRTLSRGRLKKELVRGNIPRAHSNGTSLLPTHFVLLLLITSGRKGNLALIV